MHVVVPLAIAAGAGGNHEVRGSKLLGESK
jgi:hypothetical protein